MVNHDTGVMARNLYFSRITAHLLKAGFDPKALYLDFAGGYGIFTRLMRDYGYNFYWSYRYAENLVARGFEYKEKLQKPALITAFEVLEHLSGPLAEIEDMFQHSENLLFTTRLVPEPVPAPEDWWYYSFEGGQHIALYTKAALQKIAARFGKHLQTNGKSVHLLSAKPMSNLQFKWALIRSGVEMKIWSGLGLSSKTETDMDEIIRNNFNEDKLNE